MWIAYCILCLIMWGLWGFFPKLAVRHLDPLSAAVYQGLGSVVLFAPVVVAALLMMLMMKVSPSILAAYHLPELKLTWHRVGFLYALFAGITVSLGGLFYVFAAAKQNVSVVVTITALYPIVTILLGWRVLGEEIRTRQWIGIALALAAMALVAQAPKK